MYKELRHNIITLRIIRLNDNADIDSITVTLPESYTDEEIFESLDSLYEILDKHEEIETIGIMHQSGQNEMSAMMSMMGSGTSVYVLLNEEYYNDTTRISEEISKDTENLPFEVTVSSANMDMSMLSGSQISVGLYSNDLDNLKETALDLTEKLLTVEGVETITNGLEDNNNEYRVIVNKDAYGVELYPAGKKVATNGRRVQRDEIITFYNPEYDSKGPFFDILSQVVYMGTLTLVNIDKNEDGTPAERLYVKRAVGMAGDVVKIKNGDASIKLAGTGEFLSEAEVREVNNLSKCMNPTHSPPNKESPILKFLNAIETPYIGT